MNVKRLREGARALGVAVFTAISGASQTTPMPIPDHSGQVLDRPQPHKFVRGRAGHLLTERAA